MPRSQLRPNPHPAPGYARRAALRARPTMLSMGAGYSDLVLSTDPIAYWPLWETGGSVAQCLVNPAQNGTAVGVTWANDLTPMGTPAPFFDGANDYTDAWSAVFAAAFSGAEGSIALWCRVVNAASWTDGTARVAYRPQANGNNFIYIRKSSVNDTFQWAMTAGGVGGINTFNPINTTAWFNVAMTWTGGQFQSYYAGAPNGAPVAIGAWAGNLVQNVIGASAIPVAAPWHGWLAHCAVWDRALTPATINALATV